ncbi:MAG: hypothetical protein IPN97_07050 [Saprospiraceae bacterium]|nr:hypothetical protein [Saprospiraceae bacterium]
MNETIIFIFVKWIFKGRFYKEDSTTPWLGWRLGITPRVSPGVIDIQSFQDWAGR